MRIESIILKFRAVPFGEISDIQMNKLRPERHQLWDSLQKIIRQLIAETHPVCLMFIQVDRALPTPGSLVLLQLNLIVFLRITT